MNSSSSPSGNIIIHCLVVNVLSRFQLVKLPKPLDFSLQMFFPAPSIQEMIQVLSLPLHLRNSGYKYVSLRKNELLNWDSITLVSLLSVWSILWLNEMLDKRWTFDKKATDINISFYSSIVMVLDYCTQGWGGGHFFELPPPPWPKKGTASASRPFTKMSEARFRS